MFKRHSLQVSVVKTPKNQTETTEEQKPFMTKDEAHAIAKDMMKRTAFTVVAIMAASVVLNVAGQLIIMAAESGTEDEED